MSAAGSRVAFLRREPGVALGFAVLSLVTCWPVLASGERWGFWDWDIFLSNFEVARASVVRFGELPGWNPYLRGGEDLTSHPLLPLATPAFLSMLLLGTLPGVKCWIVVRQFAALYGAYLLGARLGLARWGAVAAALVFGLASTYAQRVGHGHWNLAAFVFLPLVIHAALEAVRPGRWRARAWAAVWLALMLLDGGPYTLFLGGLGLAAAVVAGLGRGEWRSALAGAFAAGALALVLSGVKLVPVLETWGGPDRAVPYGPGVQLDFYDPDFSPGAGEFLHAALLERQQASRPGRFATFHINVGAYVGPLGLLLAAWGIAAGGLARRAVALGLPVLWLSMGNAAPFNLWEALHGLPVFETMTVPAKFTPGYLLALAVAVGVGVDALRRRLTAFQRGGWVVAAAVAGLALDLLWVSRPLFAHAFPIEPIPVTRGAFHQVRTSPYELEYFRRVTLPVGVRPFTPEPRHSLSANLPAVRANLGVLDTVSGNRLITRVYPRPDPGERLRVFQRSRVAGRAPDLVEWSPNRMRVELDPRRGGRLVVNQNHHPGWRATAGSKSLPVVAHRGGLLAVELSPGAREVTLDFHSAARATGAGISVAGCACAALAFARRS